MRRSVRIAAAAALAVAGCLAAGSAAGASAATVPGAPCDEVDYQVTPGTTVVFTYTDCPYEGYQIHAGSPTVVVGQGGSDGQPLIWYQSVGRASDSAPCDDGWSASWAQWPNDGAGGPVCNREIDWGIGPGDGGPTTLSVTVNTLNDWFENGSEGDNYVAGCDVSADFYPDTYSNCTS